VDGKNLISMKSNYVWLFSQNPTKVSDKKYNAPKLTKFVKIIFLPLL